MQHSQAHLVLVLLHDLISPHVVTFRDCGQSFAVMPTAESTPRVRSHLFGLHTRCVKRYKAKKPPGLTRRLCHATKARKSGLARNLLAIDGARTAKRTRKTLFTGQTCAWQSGELRAPQVRFAVLWGFNGSIHSDSLLDARAPWFVASHRTFFRKSKQPEKPAIWLFRAKCRPPKSSEAARSFGLGRLRRDPTSDETL